MKAKQLKAIITGYFPDLTCETVLKLNNHDVVELHLPDGGRVSIGYDPRNRQVRFDFLHFNIRQSNIRLKESDSYNGKYNYFGTEPVSVLNSLLTELKTLL